MISFSIVANGKNTKAPKAIKVPFPSVSEQSWIVKYLIEIFMTRRTELFEE